MSTTIEPLSRLPAGAVRDFLTGYGHGRAEIDWKYFDGDFNSGRERGFACVAGGRIVSFLGLIPFTAVHNGRAVEAAWSCDWYRDPQASGPLGLLLIRQSLAAYPWVYSLGGSEMTRSIMSRLARLTVPTAGVELYKPLRLGGVAYLLEKAAKLPSLPLAGLGSLPVPSWAAAAVPGPDLRSECHDGWPPNLPGLLKTSAAAGHRPAYDEGYLRWLLARCPAIASAGACLISRQGELVCALLFWHATGDSRFWRLALLPGLADPPLFGLALRATVRHLRQQGAWLVSLLLSQQERNWLAVARAQGFRSPRSRRPLYILTRDPGTEPIELDRLSYLDTDYAYRFPTAAVPSV